MAEKTSYFDGGVLSFIGWSILTGLIVICTLGVGTPWAVCMMMSWVADHTVISGQRMKFNGSGGSLFLNFIIWYLLTVITLGIYSFWMYVNMFKWVAKNTVSFEEPGREQPAVS